MPFSGKETTHVRTAFEFPVPAAALVCKLRHSVGDRSDRAPRTAAGAPSVAVGASRGPAAGTAAASPPQGLFRSALGFSEPAPALQAARAGAAESGQLAADRFAHARGQDLS